MALATAAGLWIGAELRALAPDYAAELKVILPSPNWWLGVVLGSAALGYIGARVAVARELRRFAAAR